MIIYLNINNINKMYKLSYKFEFIRFKYYNYII